MKTAIQIEVQQGDKIEIGGIPGQSVAVIRLYADGEAVEIVMEKTFAEEFFARTAEVLKGMPTHIVLPGSGPVPS